MKKSLVIVSLITISSSVTAMNLEYFLGTGIERGNATFNATVSVPNMGYSESISDNVSDIGLKLNAGTILDKTHRMSLSLTKFSGAGSNVNILLGNYDYLIPINNEFRFYAGLHAGNAQYKKAEIKMSGLAYGTQVGAIYDITKNIEFELALGYTKYDVEKTLNRIEQGVNVSRTVEFEDAISMFGGINYKF